MTDRKYDSNGYKKYKSSVLSIDWEIIENVYDIFDGSVLITYITNLLFRLSLNDKYIVYKIIK